MIIDSKLPKLLVARMRPRHLYGDGGVAACYDACSMPDRICSALAEGEPAACTGMVHLFDQSPVFRTAPQTWGQSVREQMVRQLRAGRAPGGQYRGMVCVPAGTQTPVLGFRTWTESACHDPRAREATADPYAERVRTLLRTLQPLGRRSIEPYLSEAPHTLLLDTICSRSRGIGSLLMAHTVRRGLSRGYRLMTGYRHGSLHATPAGRDLRPLGLVPGGNNDTSQRFCARWGLRDFATRVSDWLALRVVATAPHAPQAYFIESTEVWFIGELAGIADRASQILGTEHGGRTSPPVEPAHQEYGCSARHETDAGPASCRHRP